MATTELLFDLSLIGLLIGLACSAMHSARLYTGVVLFIVFGLMLALTWARLGAMDLALAEAAIGAGLIGVMLLAALAGAATEHRSESHRLASAGSLLLGLLVLALLMRGALPLLSGSQPLPEQVMAQLDTTGVSHPVTAVLLNYRAWDTLLELVVVLLALLGLRQLHVVRRQYATPWPLLSAWSRVLVPIAVVLAGYLLWRGSHAPGGAFQAGAVLAAGAVVLRLAGLLPALGWQRASMRVLVLMGAGVFVMVAATTAWLGQGWLVYPAGWNSTLIILIEIAATLSIAASLTLLVVGEGNEVEP
ncbi:hydrogenase subunit MbhD domain-containing protein [Halopseudomonas salegens]|uniref:hydrogenase subunit MbhD domain-containing protein n=1 Tax=Halopseudomonas salegens TaxID=1434072 RepID=UPI001E514849|nr:MnhB domain-containing protein [Halopseudomonas salegens]